MDAHCATFPSSSFLKWIGDHWSFIQKGCSWIAIEAKSFIRTKSSIVTINVSNIIKSKTTNLCSQNVLSETIETNKIEQNLAPWEKTVRTITDPPHKATAEGRIVSHKHNHTQNIKRYIKVVARMQEPTQHFTFQSSLEVTFTFWIRGWGMTEHDEVFEKPFWLLRFVFFLDWNVMKKLLSNKVGKVKGSLTLQSHSRLKMAPWFRDMYDCWDNFSILSKNPPTFVKWELNLICYWGLLHVWRKLLERECGEEDMKNLSTSQIGCSDLGWTCVSVSITNRRPQVRPLTPGNNMRL